MSPDDVNLSTLQKWRWETKSGLKVNNQLVAYATRFLAARLKKYVWSAALQAATILVAMASEKNIWRPKFWRKSPIGDQQSKKETYLKKYQ